MYSGSTFLNFSWWRHLMETFSALLALCAENSPVTGEFPAQRPVTRSFDIFFDLCLKIRLCKQSRRRGFETPPRSLWRRCNKIVICAWINGWVNNREAGNFGSHRAHYDVTIMSITHLREQGVKKNSVVSKYFKWTRLHLIDVSQNEPRVSVISEIVCNDTV